MNSNCKLQCRGLAVLTVVAVAFVWLTHSVFFDTVKPKPSAMAEDEIFMRIRPDAQQNVMQASVAPKEFANGEAVYRSTCAACHEAGVLGSPKFSNRAQWAPRIAQGYATLLKNATTGIRQMPARGGNATLTDYDIGRAIVYMTKAAGASFPEPKAPKK